MIARRLTLAALISLSAFVSVFAVGTAPAIATPVQFAPGQVIKNMGIAVDQAAGNDVYVAEPLEGQIDAFESSGSLVSIFGKEQFGESPGRNGTSGPIGVAVDNELSSLSYGDLYVVDGTNNRVDKFSSTGNFLLMFGGGVNEKTDGDVCVAGEACKAGTAGTADGEFEGAFDESFIAVGPAGRVYVGDRARVQVFEPSGVWRENVSLSGLSATGRVTALAVDSAGDMFVKDEGVAGVREFEPNGTEKAIQFDAGSGSVQALAVGVSGELFVSDSSDGGHILEYDSAGKQLANFGSETSELVGGIAYSSALNKLYVTDYLGPIWALTPPVAGPPTIEEGSVSAVGSLRGRASFAAKLDPGDFETTYHFEYVDQSDFQASGYVDASNTPSVVVEPTLEGQSVNVDLTGLTPGDTYHYRLVATNSKGTVTSPDHTFEEVPPALISGVWVTNVASTSATFGAEINPLGVSTEYLLEYGTSTSYGQSASGSLGEGEAYVPVTIHRQELLPGTVYHYRIVTHNQFGTTEGSDHSFTTQTANVGSVSADGRAWELVSPANKKGALIELFEQGGEVQAASGGSGISYLTQGPHVGEDPVGKITFSPVLSRRGPTGWGTIDLNLPGRLPENGEPSESISEYQPEYRLFSPDLSLAMIEPQGGGTPPLSPEATERTLYLRNDLNESFLPLVTAANVPSGRRIEEPTFVGAKSDEFEMHFLASTPDLGHVVFETPMALTPEAIDEENTEHYSSGHIQWNLYEWGEGKLRLVNILPPPSSEVAHGPDPAPGVRLAGVTYGPGGDAQRSVSSDGRRIAWAWGEPYGSQEAREPPRYRGLFVRDMVEEKTVRVGGANAIYQTMNSEGSKIFFLENGDLYEFDYDTGTQTDLTGAHGPGESSASVQEVVSDVSEDGSYVYFVAKGVLANGGVSGEDNLYLLHDTGAGWATTYIATLSNEDEPSWYARGAAGSFIAPALAEISSRVSPDGHYLAFMSERSLTGYDNIDAVSGQPDEEVYLYDAQAGTLVCASCDPTGARPVGVFDNANSELLVDRDRIWTEHSSTNTNHWLAGSIPGWDDPDSRPAAYQPRYLSDSGRLFFDSPDALVPQDTNGLEDVYEYEPAGVGGCVAGGVTFGERSNGCVGLMSSGTSSSESAFYDASENGDDVFFDTTGKLVGEDYDTGYDVYDAHVCSSAVPCAPVPVSPPPCDSGDSCKAAPSPQPEIFGPAPSATFNGVGNVVSASTQLGKVKKKSIKCSKGKKLSQGKCVKKKGKKSKKARKSSNNRRGK